MVKKLKAHELPYPDIQSVDWLTIADDVLGSAQEHSPDGSANRPILEVFKNTLNLHSRVKEIESDGGSVPRKEGIGFYRTDVTYLQFGEVKSPTDGRKFVSKSNDNLNHPLPAENEEENDWWIIDKSGGGGGGSTVVTITQGTPTLTVGDIIVWHTKNKKFQPGCSANDDECDVFGRITAKDGNTYTVIKYGIFDFDRTDEEAGDYWLTADAKNKGKITNVKPEGEDVFSIYIGHLYQNSEGKWKFHFDPDVGYKDIEEDLVIPFAGKETQILAVEKATDGKVESVKFVDKPTSKSLGELTLWPYGKDRVAALNEGQCPFPLEDENKNPYENLKDYNPEVYDQAKSEHWFLGLYQEFGNIFGGEDTEAGFHMPTSLGQFFRVRGGEAGDFGKIQEDAIRNITGALNKGGSGFMGAVQRSGTHEGALYGGKKKANSSASGNAGYTCEMFFDASRIVPTADENRPTNLSCIAALCFRESNPAPPNRGDVNTFDGLFPVAGNINPANSPTIKKMIKETPSLTLRIREKGDEVNDTEYTALQDFWLYALDKNTDKTYARARINVNGITVSANYSYDTSRATAIALIKKNDIYKIGLLNPDSEYIITHVKFKEGKVHELAGKTVYLFNPDVNNVFVGNQTIKERPVSVPINYTLIEPPEDIEGKCKVFNNNKWEYREDPLPELRNLCDWIEPNVGFEGGYVVNKEKLVTFLIDEVIAFYKPYEEQLSKALEIAEVRKNQEEWDAVQEMYAELDKEKLVTIKAIREGSMTSFEPESKLIVCPDCGTLLKIDKNDKKYCPRCGWKE